VVTLASGLIRYVYPSKTFGYLAAGVPILARVELDSELARSLNQSGAGIAVDPHDDAGLRRAITRFAHMSDEELTRMGENAREMSKQHRKSVVLDQWVALFQELVEAHRD
jgi:glycosyltransferase involved in cell wall biosynthesis